jgi:hypothetical protein
MRGGLSGVSSKSAAPLSLTRDANEVNSELRRKRLLREYEAATVAFSAAVQELRRRMGTSPREEYKRLAHSSNDARVKSEGARLALEQHIATHGC